MANTVQQPSKPPTPPPSHINITVATSPGTLHKHGSATPFTLTLEATFPEAPDRPNKPLTVLAFDTLLYRKGPALFEQGLRFINSTTGIPATGPSIHKRYGFGNKSYTLVDSKFDRYFITLEPGVPFQVTYTLRPCPKVQSPNEHNPGGDQQTSREGNATADDEAIVAGALSHVTYLEVGSTYLIQLGDKLSHIDWYRYGYKEHILDQQDDLGSEKRPERIGDSQIQPIPLILQGSASFNVKE